MQVGQTEQRQLLRVQRLQGLVQLRVERRLLPTLVLHRRPEVQALERGGILPGLLVDEPVDVVNHRKQRRHRRRQQQEVLRRQFCDCSATLSARSV